MTREILLLAPSIRENVQIPTAQVWHTNFRSACVESTPHKPSSCPGSKHTSYRYSHFYCNCYAHQDAVFFEHNTNMLNISHLLWMSAYHCKKHILYPSTHHKWHSPHHPPKGDSFIEWGMSHQPFIQGITLPWHFHKQETKIYHSEHNYTQETSLQPFSVHYSANNEVNTASSHHSVSTIGAVLYSTSCISC